MHFHSSALTNRIDPFVGLCFDIDGTSWDGEQSSNVLTDPVTMRSELGTLADDRRVEIHDLHPCCCDSERCFCDEICGILGFVPWIGIREELSDVRLSDRSEQCIGDRMEQCVCVGMSHWTA